jgi:hypothetical protein
MRRSSQNIHIWNTFLLSCPSDLLLPFGEFVKSYALQPMVGLVFGFTQGLGDVLAHTTLYVMKLFGPELVKELATESFTTTLHDNSSLYEHARVDLRENGLLNSSILEVDRNSRNGAKILVKTPSGDTHRSSEVGLYNSAQAGKSSWMASVGIREDTIQAIRKFWPLHWFTSQHRHSSQSLGSKHWPQHALQSSNTAWSIFNHASHYSTFIRREVQKPSRDFRQ